MKRGDVFFDIVSFLASAENIPPPLPGLRLEISEMPAWILGEGFAVNKTSPEKSCALSTFSSPRPSVLKGKWTVREANREGRADQGTLVYLLVRAP